jgi:hypothetical protein
MMNGGGQTAVSQFVQALQSKPNLEAPKVDEPGMLVFDDTEKDLMKVARDLKLKRKSFEDFDSGSLFDIAYRAARSIAPSLFMGTRYIILTNLLTFLVTKCSTWILMMKMRNTFYQFLLLAYYPFMLIMWYHFFKI